MPGDFMHSKKPAKRRWTDPGPLSASLRATDKKFTRHTVVSYKVFCKEQQAKLTGQYPFLTKQQIVGKVRQLWTNLNNEDKKYYTKTVLHVTPSKKLCHPLNVEREEKDQVNIRLKESLESNSRTFKDTVRNAYEDDFGFAQLMSPSPKKGLTSPDWINGKADRSISVTGKDYARKGYLLDNNRKVPQVVHDTPSNQQGILKSYREPECTTKGSVSFSTKDETSSVPFVDSVKRPVENAADDGDILNSSDEDADSRLIRRDLEDYNFDNIEDFGLCVEIENDSKKSKRGRRKNTPVPPCNKLMEKDTHNMNKERNCQSEKENNKNNLRREDKITGSRYKHSHVQKESEPENVHNLNQAKNKLTKLEKSPAEQLRGLKQAVNMMRGRKNLLPVQNKSHTKKIRDLKQVVQIMRSKKKSPKNAVGELTENDSEPVKTPQFQGPSNYTTPLMDNDDYNCVVEGVEKAPRKRRSSSAAIGEQLTGMTTSGSEVHSEPSMKGATSNIMTQRKVRTSLLGPDGVTFINEKGDANIKIGTREEDDSETVHVQKNVRQTPNIDKCRYKLRNGNSPVVKERNPSSNSRETTKIKSRSRPHEMEKNHLLSKGKRSSGNKAEKRITADDRVTRFELKLKKSRDLLTKPENDIDHNVQCNLETSSGICTKKSSGNGRITDCQNFESTLFKDGDKEVMDADATSPSMSPDGEPDAWDDYTMEPIVTRNQALMQILQRMKNVVAASPVLSGVSSPKLLSPAVSGISELSGFSCDSAEYKQVCCKESKDVAADGAKEKDILEKPISPAKRVTRNTRTEGKTLCEMFDDITPPEENKEIMYEKRLVSSSNNESASNFTELFQEEDIFC